MIIYNSPLDAITIKRWIMILIDFIMKNNNLKKRNIKKILKKLNSKKIIEKHKFIIRIKGESNLLELVSSGEIYRLEKRKKEFAIISIANNKKEGFDKIQELVGELVIKYGGFTVKDLEREFNIIWGN